MAFSLDPGDPSGRHSVCLSSFFSLMESETKRVVCFVCGGHCSRANVDCVLHTFTFLKPLNGANLCLLMAFQ